MNVKIELYCIYVYTIQLYIIYDIKMYIMMIPLKVNINVYNAIMCSVK